MPKQLNAQVSDLFQNILYFLNAVYVKPWQVLVADKEQHMYEPEFITHLLCYRIIRLLRAVHGRITQKIQEYLAT